MKKLLIILLSSLFLVAACSSGPQYTKEQLDSLANCLAEKQVKEYGAFWCPNCAKQEKMFKDSFPIIKESVYIECDPRCDVSEEELPIACRGKQGQPLLCIEKGIDKYPTWEMPSGETFTGITELSILAEKSGCSM